MKKFITNNSLSLAFFVLFMMALNGQIYCGFAEYNKTRLKHGGTPVSLPSYFQSGHFLESTFENWESEFLQMALLVVLTIFLKQKGSSESKDFNKKEDTDQEPQPYFERRNAPWPVKKGGWILCLYENSLTIAFTLLFIISFFIHFYGSLKDENEELIFQSLPPVCAMEYFTDSRFWFESFQNWQSEFLSVSALIIFSIYLRQKGSSQSKPVDAPHFETGK